MVIFQTTIMPYIPFFVRFYDLFAPLIVYLALFHPPREGIIVMLFLGIVMDGLSGGPIGFFLTIYFWLFILVRWMKTFLHAGNTIILPFVVALGVLFENLAFLGMTALLDPDSQVPASALKTVSVQILWAICTGPFVIMFFNYTYKRWNKWCSELFAGSSKHGRA